MNKYSEKEIQIFSGVLKLAGQGMDLSRITARQIADAAGMGKATIYDYFPSKEEIISKAMFYSIEMQKQRFEKAVSCAADFKSKMMCVYDGVIDSVENSSSLFNMAMAAKGGMEPGSFHKEGKSCPLEGAAKNFFTVIYIAYGQSVGIALITGQSQHTVRAFMQNFFTLFCGKFLFFLALFLPFLNYIISYTPPLKRGKFSLVPY